MRDVYDRQKGEEEGERNRRRLGELEEINVRAEH